MSFRLTIVARLTILAALPVAGLAQVGTKFTYQGYLDDGGTPVDGVVDLQFRLFKTSIGGSQVGATITQRNKPVVGGVFSTQIDFGAGVFDGSQRWLELSVRIPAGAGSYNTLSPRDEITATPYAIYALTGPFWALGGNANTDPMLHFVGTSDNVPLELRANNQRILRLEGYNPALPSSGPNLIGGYDGNTLDAGVTGAVLLGGAQGPANHNAVHDSYAVIAGGVGNNAGWADLDIDENGDGTVDGDWFATVGGGIGNFAYGYAATIAGGNGNLAGAPDDGQPGGPFGAATVGGGIANSAFGLQSTVAGGAGNSAPGISSAIAGGYFNYAYDYAAIGGGDSNVAVFQAAIAGGLNNYAGAVGFVGGGELNTAGIHGVVGGGYDNLAQTSAVVAGGRTNNASGQYSAIGGGQTNSAYDNHCTVGGGQGNIVGSDDGALTNATHATIAGGNGNDALAIFATVGGGNANQANAFAATVGGGSTNDAGATYATIAGGRLNDAAGDYTAISGGQGGTALGDWACLGGGFGNVANDIAATVAGGSLNAALSPYSTAGGGQGNDVLGANSTIGGGYFNTTDDDYCTVAGGQSNIAGNGDGVASVVTHATVAGGDSNWASQTCATVGGGRANTASADSATVPGGLSCTASGARSFAAGRRAKAVHGGSFVWADNTDADVSSTTANAFYVRASAGMWFGTNSSPSIVGGRFINTSTGAYLTTGGTWTNSSSRALKENFEPVSGLEILERVAELPIRRWNYIVEGQRVRHLGPVAEDFSAAFGLGDSNEAIGTVDADGVALAAIQGLHTLVERQRGELHELRDHHAQLQQRNDELRERLDVLEALITQHLLGAK